MTETSKTILTVGRAMEVLTLFTERRESTLGVTEISKALGLSKAVVHRILSTLLEKDYIQIEPQTRRYALGHAALKLGLTYFEGIDVRRMAQPILHELVTATQETSTLSIRSGWTRIYIDQETPPTDIRMSVRLGHPYPLHAGSSSKALLAFLDPEEQDAYLATGPFERLTDTTITTPAQLRADLDRIRKRGYARSLGSVRPTPPRWPPRSSTTGASRPRRSACAAHCAASNRRSTRRPTRCWTPYGDSRP